MKQFVIYEASSGRILRVGNCLDQDFDAQASGGEAVFEGLGDWATQYFVEGEPVARPTSSVALSQAGAVITLTGVNTGIGPSIVNERAQAISVASSDGGEISVTLPPGAYVISVDQFPEVQFSQRITVA